jgi:hypothetical protein
MAVRRDGQDARQREHVLTLAEFLQEGFRFVAAVHRAGVQPPAFMFEAEQPAVLQRAVPDLIVGLGALWVLGVVGLDCDFVC